MTDEQAKENIAENVRRLRAERSQYWLAKECDTYPANIARIEAGGSMPGGGMLSRLAAALEVTIDELVADPPPPKKRRKTG